jgi:DNA-binding response OmpR family regulator
VKVQTTKTILLVEDDFEVREAMAIWLRYENYEVIEASDGVEGLRLALDYEGSIFALLTDFRMPRLDGEFLIRMLIDHKSSIEHYLLFSAHVGGGARLLPALDKRCRIFEKPADFPRVLSVLNAPTSNTGQNC